MSDDDDVYINRHIHPFPNIFTKDCPECLALVIKRKDENLTKARQTPLSDAQYLAMVAYGDGVARDAAARDRNAEYGYPDGHTDIGDGYHGYTPESIEDDSIPLTRDLIQFVYWLRHHTDFFEGPNLDIHFPDVNTPDFDKVLGDLAIIFTGE